MYRGTAPFSREPSFIPFQPVSLISNDKCPVFTFRVVNPASPSELDLSDDSRRLGIGFASMRLVCAG
jgi:hypothetical protein